MPRTPPDLLSDRLTDRLASSGWRLRRAVLARRRLLAFVLAVVAVLAGLRATSSPAAPTVPVTVAAHDLPAGAALRPDDLRVVDLVGATAPEGRVRDPVGRVLAGPVRRGEAVTDVRLVGAALTSGRPGLVTAPIRFPDAEMVALLHVGDQIDVLAADAQGGVPALLARDCPVLALPAPEGAAGGSGAVQDGRLVVLGLPESTVTAVSGAAVSHFLSFTFAG